MKILCWYSVALLWLPTASSASADADFCGSGTTFAPDINQCLCINSTVEEAKDEIYIAGVIDTSLSFTWAQHSFQATMYMLRNGWQGILQSTGSVSTPPLRYTLRDSKCDPTAAARAYWKTRTENGDQAPQGIVGARCSGASMSLARIAGLESVPQVSPISNSAKLSSDEEFPYFSRLVAPNDYRGEVGALVALLRMFGWEQVTLLITDTDFGKDLATEFRALWVGDHNDMSGEWKGEIRYSDTLRLDLEGNLDQDYLKQALSSMPSKSEPTKGSRIVLLISHIGHANEALQAASENSNVADDTIWVGPSSWINRGTVPDLEYIGVAPYQNRNSQYDDYLQRLQQYESMTDGRVSTYELPSFAAETVDSIVALVRALASLGQSDRYDGDRVVQRLREVEFDGVSGRVAFTEIGDRKDPVYSILNYKSSDNVYDWDDVGSVGATVGSAVLTAGKEVCFPEVDCSDSSFPEDTYPVPKEKMEGWQIFLMVLFAVLFILILIKYWRSHKSKMRIKDELEVFRQSVVGMRAAEKVFIPTISRASTTEGSTIDLAGELAIVVPQEQVLWCWQETPGSYMDSHDPQDIVDAAQCWIKYSSGAQDELEAAYQEQGGKGTCSPMIGYVVDFSSMVQTKLATGFRRSVQRLVQKIDPEEAAHHKLDLEEAQLGAHLPEDLVNEPQMILVVGDIVQISKQRPDGWAFGSKVCMSF